MFIIILIDALISLTAAVGAAGSDPDHPHSAIITPITTPDNIGLLPPDNAAVILGVVEDLASIELKDQTPSSNRGDMPEPSNNFHEFAVEPDDIVEIKNYEQGDAFHEPVPDPALPILGQQATPIEQIVDCLAQNLPLIRSDRSEVRLDIDYFQSAAILALFEPYLAELVPELIQGAEQAALRSRRLCLEMFDAQLGCMAPYFASVTMTDDLLSSFADVFLSIARYLYGVFVHHFEREAVKKYVQACDGLPERERAVLAANAGVRRQLRAAADRSFKASLREMCERFPSPFNGVIEPLLPVLLQHDLMNRVSVPLPHLVEFTRVLDHNADCIDLEPVTITSRSQLDAELDLPFLQKCDDLLSIVRQHPFSIEPPPEVIAELQQFSDYKSGAFKEALEYHLGRLYDMILGVIIAGVNDFSVDIRRRLFNAVRSYLALNRGEASLETTAGQILAVLNEVTVQYAALVRDQFREYDLQSAFRLSVAQTSKKLCGGVPKSARGHVKTAIKRLADRISPFSRRPTEEKLSTIAEVEHVRQYLLYTIAKSLPALFMPIIAKRANAFLTASGSFLSDHSA